LLTQSERLFLLRGDYMSETSFFLPDDAMDLLLQHNFSTQDFIKPKFLPRTETAKSQVIWTPPSAETVSRMISLTGLTSDDLGCVIGLSAKSVILYMLKKSQYPIKFTNWQLLCKTALLALQGYQPPRPDTYIFNAAERECLTRYFDDVSLKYPIRADNGLFGVLLWHHAPSLEQVKYAMNYLSEQGYNVPKLMVEWNLDDRTVRRKKKEADLDFSLFVILCGLILSCEGLNE